ncbi:MAG: polysaccharide deacetylase family protein [Clostridiales bacterium]|nr:polysaccharide deacetylase family protein [Clostridiales bacterium]
MRKKGNREKPLAAISLDLDNLWSYIKTHGDRGWEDYPSYFHIFIPRVLEVLKDLDLKITFFIVGKDATLQKNRRYLEQIFAHGHEVGNHSYWHEPWLSIYARKRIEQEIRDAERAIIEVTGQKPLGFRGPGFCTSNDIFDVLINLGYLYDASVLPTFLGPLARAYYFKRTEFQAEEKTKRKELFGNLKDGLRPAKPHFLMLPSGKKLLEIPISCTPLLKMPFHLSYLMYVARYSKELMRFYLNFAISLCMLTKTPLSFLLHPLDLMGKEDAPKVAFFPAMDMSREKKRMIFVEVLGTLAKHFRLVSMNVFAHHILREKESLVTRSYRN